MGQKELIYLDTAAATPLDRRVKTALDQCSRVAFANPASLHRSGVAAARALADARARVAVVLGAHPDEIIFTSGGTEANNLALFGVLAPLGHPMSKLITSQIEHASVLEPAKKLAAQGTAVVYLPVDSAGVVNLKKLKAALTPDTKLISIIYAHNEIGTVQPVKEIVRIIRRAAIDPKPYLHLDACQAPRFLDLNVDRLGVDLMTLNASKIYGPHGVGCLYVRRGVKLNAQLVGGGQEGDRRAGTENVAGAIGLAAALEICQEERESEGVRLIKLRDYLIGGLLRIDGVKLNGPAPNASTGRLPNNVNVSVAGVEGEQLVIELDEVGVACSTGSACSIPDHNDSHVIMALGRTKAEASSTARFTLGRDTTLADIKYLLKVFPKIIEKLRKFNQLAE